MAIKVYGATWCPDCRRAKKFLGERRVPFEWHDIEIDPDGVKVVEERNKSTKQLASAVGEGSAAALSIRAYLDTPHM